MYTFCAYPDPGKWTKKKERRRRRKPSAEMHSPNIWMIIIDMERNERYERINNKKIYDQNKKCVRFFCRAFFTIPYSFYARVRMCVWVQRVCCVGWNIYSKIQINNNGLENLFDCWIENVRALCMLCVPVFFPPLLLLCWRWKTKVFI